MKFINEDDHILVLLQLGHHGFEALLKLSTILGSGDNACHIEGHHSLIFEQLGDFLLNNLLGQTLNDRSLTNARLANQHRIIFFATAKNLDQALNFRITPNDGVQLSFTGKLSEIATKMIEERSFGFGSRTCRGRSSFAGGVRAGIGRRTAQNFFDFFLGTFVVQLKRGQNTGRSRLVVLDQGK